MNMKKIILSLKKQKDTAALARTVAGMAMPATALLLTGDLGAGKTTLTMYLCKELSIDPRQVSSPTFSVIHEYHGGRLPVAHVDLYRLGNGADVYELCLDEYLERGFFVVVEWAEFMTESLECPFVRINLTLMEDGTRQAEVEASVELSGQEFFQQGG